MRNTWPGILSTIGQSNTDSLDYAIPYGWSRHLHAERSGPPATIDMSRLITS